MFYVVIEIATINSTPDTQRTSNGTVLWNRHDRTAHMILHGNKTN